MQQFPLQFIEIEDSVSAVRQNVTSEFESRNDS